MRCKFVCNSKKRYQYQNDAPTFELAFSPVYTGSDENKAFFAATPGGTMTLFTVNEAAADRFEMGKEYYLDFSPAAA